MHLNVEEGNQKVEEGSCADAYPALTAPTLMAANLLPGQVRFQWAPPTVQGVSIVSMQVRVNGAAWETVSLTGSRIVNGTVGQTFIMNARVQDSLGRWSPTVSRVGTPNPEVPRPPILTNDPPGATSVTFHWQQQTPPRPNEAPLNITTVQMSVNNGAWTSVGGGNGSRTLSDGYRGTAVQVRVRTSVTHNGGNYLSAPSSPITVTIP